MIGKVQKIREKVEMVVNRRLNLLNGDYFDLNKESDGFTNEIMDVIDSLQEDPVSEDLEEAADNALSNVLNTHEIVNVRSCLEMFRFGVEWQKQKDSISVSEELEEVSKKYGTKKHPMTTIGANESACDFKEGAKWHEQQMMTNAIDTTIKRGCIELGILIKGLDEDKFSFGDKVKVIIIKKD